MTIRVFTAAAVNYLPKARLLAESVKRFHPDAEIWLALADRVPPWFDLADEPFDGLVAVEDLHEVPDLTRWIFFHNVAELSTAIKPFALQRLLAMEPRKPVVYLDPDIVLFADIAAAIDRFADASIVLTPHVATPETSLDGILDNEIASLRHGVFNLGFLGVNADEEGRRFARWWGDRLYHFCREAFSEGVWTDQKWINFVPVFFDRVSILKAGRFNVAPWNLSTRRLTGSFEEGFEVDGEPLAFYHFTGFDSGAHSAMVGKYAPGRSPARELVDWYRTELGRRRDERVETSRWAFGAYSNGESVRDVHRLIYRLRADVRERFPDPFAVPDDAPSYLGWFRRSAAREHPEILRRFRPDGRPRELASSLVAVQTSSHRPLRAAGRHLLDAFARGEAAPLAQKAWRVLRDEGIGGLRSRLGG